MIPQARIDQYKERIKSGEQIRDPEELKELSAIIAQVHIKCAADIKARRANTRKTTKKTAKKKVEPMASADLMALLNKSLDNGNKS